MEDGNTVKYSGIINDGFGGSGGAVGRDHTKHTIMLYLLSKLLQALQHWVQKEKLK